VATDKSAGLAAANGRASVDRLTAPQFNDSERLRWLLGWMESYGLLVRYENAGSVAGRGQPAWVLRAPFVVGVVAAVGAPGTEPRGAVSAVDAAIELDGWRNGRGKGG
jgi:hypothetical protein